VPTRASVSSTAHRRQEDISYSVSPTNRASCNNHRKFGSETVQKDGGSYCEIALEASGVNCVRRGISLDLAKRFNPFYEVPRDKLDSGFPRDRRQ